MGPFSYWSRLELDAAVGGEEVDILGWRVVHF